MIFFFTLCRPHVDASFEEPCKQGRTIESVLFSFSPTSFERVRAAERYAHEAGGVISQLFFSLLASFADEFSREGLFFQRLEPDQAQLGVEVQKGDMNPGKIIKKY